MILMAINTILRFVYLNKEIEKYVVWFENILTSTLFGRSARGLYVEDDLEMHMLAKLQKSYIFRENEVERKF